MDRHQEQTTSAGDGGNVSHILRWWVNVSLKAKDLKNLIESKLDKIDLDQAK